MSDVVTIPAFDLTHYEKCEDEIGYNSDGVVYSVYKSKESFTTFGSVGRIRYLVDENMNTVAMKLPLMSWGNGFVSIEKSEFEKQFHLFSKINSQL